MSQLFVSPEGYFTELIKEALQKRKLNPSPYVETYLVALMKHYLATDNLFEKPTQTLAEMYLHAQAMDATLKELTLKKLADKSLYVSGFFSDSLQRKIVDVDYYVNIGGNAYRQLAANTKDDAQAAVYKTFSVQFMDFVDVLTHVSQKSMITTDQNILRLYDRYLRTGSLIAKEKLIEFGVLTHPHQTIKIPKAS